MKYYYRLSTNKECNCPYYTSACAYNSPQTALAAAMNSLMHYSYENEFKYENVAVWSKQTPDSTARLVYLIEISHIKNYEHING